MAFFDHGRILEIAERAISLGLATERDALMAGLNPAFLATLPTAAQPNAQVMMDLSKLNQTPAIEGGVIPLEQWLRTASFFVSARPDEQKFFRDLADAVARKSDLSTEQRAEGAKVAAVVGTEIEEKIIFVNDLVPFEFLRKAGRAGRSVVKMIVPVHLNGTLRKQPLSGKPMEGFGTGWMIGPKHIITNHHVIDARSPGEAEASQQDFALQGDKAVVHFDYDHLEAVGERIGVAGLRAADKALDYAILELPEALTREPLTLWGGPMALTDDTPVPVNIIQHPRGRPKQMGIRNNLVAKLTDDDLAYFTDTDGGSSGAPVANDAWQIVALHKAATPEFGEQLFQGKDTAWVNIGTRIDRIIDDLKTNHASLWDAIGATVVT